MTPPYVKEHIHDGIATIEFFHPAHNSLPGELLLKLTQTITEAGQNDDVKVIILKSGGSRTFCAGASFKELININDAETGRVFFSGFAFDRLPGLPVHPIIFSLLRANGECHRLG